MHKLNTIIGLRVACFKRDNACKVLPRSLFSAPNRAKKILEMHFEFLFNLTDQ